MIYDFYNEKVDIERLTDVVILDSGGVPVANNKKNFTTHLSDVDCHIQTFDEEISKDITNGFGKDLIMFCASIDIIEGDRVIRYPHATAVEYRVVGVKNYNGYGCNNHLEIKIRAFKS